jgi:soluble lytic murein transglycosylase-like protein
VVGINGQRFFSPQSENEDDETMRFATLCAAVSFVTCVSVTSSELTNLPIGFISPAAAEQPPQAQPPQAQAPQAQAPQAQAPQAQAPQAQAPQAQDAAAAKAVQVPDKAPDKTPASSGRSKRVALSKAELCETAVQVAQANNLPAPFFTRLIQQESGFNPHTVSSAGAQGIAQFMPKTAASRGLSDPFEPLSALAASGKFLAELVGQFGNLGLAAAAYNAGPKRVQDWIAKRGKLPAETQNYVRTITGRVAEAWAATKAKMEQVGLATPAGCPEVARNEVSVPSSENNKADDVRTSQAQASVRSRLVKVAAMVRGALPRSSRFIVGRPVPAAIKAAEARVLARGKQAATKHARRGLVRLASAR